MPPIRGEYSERVCDQCMNHKLRPPHSTEVILHDVVRLDGPPLYYGRGVISGDWYATCPVLDAPACAGLLRAYSQGERRVMHPCGAPMVRLAWVASDTTTSCNREMVLELERIFEVHGLQAGN